MGENNLELSVSKKRPVLLRQGHNSLGWAEESRASTFAVENRNRIISPKELRQHNNLFDEGWMAVNGIVYDVTRYCSHHPGGWFDLSKAVGDDGTDLFKEYHGWISPNGFVGRFQVGRLKSNVKNPKLDQVSSTKRLHKLWVPIRLEKISQVADFTHIFSFSVHDSGIPLTEVWKRVSPFHVLLRVNRKGLKIVRPLSPLNIATNVPDSLLPYTRDLNRNHLHLAVKLYSKGHLSECLATARKRDMFHCAFVSSHLKFNKQTLKVEGMRGNGKFQGTFKKIGFVVAGTGLLPALQVIQYLLSQENFNAGISLVYSVSSISALLFKEFLFQLAGEGVIKLSIIISQLDASKQRELKERNANVIIHHGKFDKVFLNNFVGALPKQKSDEDSSVRILLCGPPGYEEYGPKDNKLNKALRKLLIRFGWSSSCFENFN